MKTFAIFLPLLLLALFNPVQATVNCRIAPAGSTCCCMPGGQRGCLPETNHGPDPIKECGGSVAVPVNFSSSMFPPFFVPSNRAIRLD
jgi:hypothetical protein